MELNMSFGGDLEIVYEAISGQRNGSEMNLTIPINCDRRSRSNSHTIQFASIHSAGRSGDHGMNFKHMSSSWTNQSSNSCSSTSETRYAVPRNSSDAGRSTLRKRSPDAGRSALPEHPPDAGRSIRPICSSEVSTKSALASVVICPVCLLNAEEITASDYELLTPRCGHIICSKCLKGVLEHDALCPKCRTRIISRSIRQIYL